MTNNSSHEAYPHNSAGRKMIGEFLAAREYETAGDVLRRLKKEIMHLKTVDYVYVIGKGKTLTGVVSFRDLFASSAKTKIRDVIMTALVSVSPETDREKVADLAVKHGIKAVPVVKGKKLIGIVPMEEILHTLNWALREDILHLAGIHKSHLKYENTLTVPLFLSILHRLPWLLIGLIGVTLTARFIGIFEATLQNYLILAFFIPAIVYMSDALGVQHQMLFVRDLAIMGKDLDIKKYFMKQMIIASLLGMIIGLVVFLIIVLAWKQSFTAFIIAASMFITLIISSFTALITTLTIKKLKLDPALGSGPLATIVSDMTSIVVYFVVAYLLLNV